MSPHVSKEEQPPECLHMQGLLAVWPSEDTVNASGGIPLKRRHLSGRLNDGLWGVANSEFRALDDEAVKFYHFGAQH